MADALEHCKQVAVYVAGSIILWRRFACELHEQGYCTGETLAKRLARDAAVGRHARMLSSKNGILENIQAGKMKH